MKFKILFTASLVITVGFVLFQSTRISNANSSDEPNIRLSKIGGTATLYTPTRPQRAIYQWQTVANNSFGVPGTNLTFSSYGQPSVNSTGFVVFRARTTGADRETGIYTRQFPKGPVQDVVDLNILVPYPNNLNTFFTEFPSIPRISINGQYVATRGNHKPVYKYLLPDDTETRIGTNGIYAQLNEGLVVTGASKVGSAPGFEYFAVPNTNPAVGFDVFPGSPAIADDGTIAFKGNYTVNTVGKTGVFYRRLLPTPGGGTSPVELIANSDTVIPNLPKASKKVRFGSTAPPSVAGNNLVFVGLDNEDDPHLGGIYLAPMAPQPQLRPLVTIGSPPPGINMPALTRIGEGLSFDGRYVGFWGAWGTQMKTIRLYCPEDGNADLLAYCNGVDPNSIFDPVANRWYQNKSVPVNQGIFFYDTLFDRACLLSTTNSGFADFIYWGYSGKPPGVGSTEDSELPRWRAASFLAVSGTSIVFKARTAVLDPNGVYIDPIDGLYVTNDSAGSRLQMIVETGMPGSVIDTTMVGNVPPDLPIIGLGIERDGFRGNKLAITVSMADEVDSWGGIYLADIRSPSDVGLDPIMVSRR